MHHQMNYYIQSSSKIRNSTIARRQYVPFNSRQCRLGRLSIFLHHGASQPLFKSSAWVPKNTHPSRTAATHLPFHPNTSVEYINQMFPLLKICYLIANVSMPCQEVPASFNMSTCIRFRTVDTILKPLPYL